MGIFRKNRGATDGVKRSTPSSAVLPALPIDEALDTIASAVRSLGRHAFEIDTEEQQPFTARCEAWARHILTGSHPPLEKQNQDSTATEESADKQSHNTAANGLDGNETPYAADRQWAALRHFIRGRRQAEERYVSTHLTQFRTVLWDVVNGLRELAFGSSNAGESINDSLSTLEEALKSNSLETVRREVSNAVREIRGVMDTERERVAAQMQAMGTKIATLRADLVEARRQMEIDPLTQLYNRGAFDDALRQYVNLAAITAQPLALMMIDLDHFKQINDEYGHPAGDQVLVVAANCLVRCFPRKSDLICRYGGEEFVVILWDVEHNQVTALAERLVSQLRSLNVQTDEGEIFFTASVGCTSFCRNDTPESVLKRADEALYEAKHGGRDRVVCRDPPEVTSDTPQQISSDEP